MTLQQIKYFLKVYSTESLTTAANDLFMTRSALSKAIKDLEDEYSVKLFERTSTGLIPTAAGQALKDKAMRLMHASDDIDELLSEFGGKEDGYVKVGITPLTGLHVLSTVYNSFSRENPDIHIIPIEGSKQQADTMMRSGEMDLCIVTYSDAFVDEKGSIKHDLYHNACIIGETQLMLCTAKDSKFAKLKSVPVSKLLNESFVFFKKPLQWEAEIDSRFKKFGVVPKIYVRVTHPPVLREIVSSGRAHSIQMSGILGNAKDIVEIPLDPVAKYKIAIVWTDESIKKQGVKKFVDYCKKAAE